MDHNQSDRLAHVLDMLATRRGIVRATTGGFALAVSGLFLPTAFDEEADAREGALGGAKGGRRGKNHKGRHRHRSHGDKKDKGKGHDAPPKGHGPFRATALNVINRRGQPLDCTFYYRIKTGLDDYSLPTIGVDRTIGPNESFRYDPSPDRYRVGVLIKHVFGSDDIYADVRNVSFWFPAGGVTRGPNLDPPAGKVGSMLIREQAFIQTEVHEASGITLWRKPDSADRIEWDLVIDPL